MKTFRNRGRKKDGTVPTATPPSPQFREVMWRNTTTNTSPPCPRKSSKPFVSQTSIFTTTEYTKLNRSLAHGRCHLPRLEFLYEDKSHLVETKKLQNLLDIQRAFLATSSRFLELDTKDLSEATFHRLLEFMHTGQYRPDIPYPISSTSPGPILKPDSTNGKAQPMLADVPLVKFGTILDFDECSSYAIKHLNSYTIVSEDPIAILQAIYADREPSQKLKDWTRKFLLAPYSMSTSLAYADMGGGELPNLLKLENEHFPWRTRFLDAMESNGALQNEIWKARQELRNKGWMGNHEQCLLTGNCMIGMNNMMRYASTLNLLTLGGMSLNGFLWQQQQQQLLLGGTATATKTPGLSTPNLARLLAQSPYNPIAISSLANNLSNTNSSALSLAIELEQLKHLQCQKIRELEREKSDLRERERKKDRASEISAQVRVVAFMEQMCGSGFRGFVETASEDERY
jgi:hypothetical protein